MTISRSVRRFAIGLCAAGMVLCGWVSPAADAATSNAGPDFDSDGYADLVIGVPYDEDDVGTVRVVYGSLTGPTSDRTQRISPNDDGMVGDRGWRSFGQAVAWADFDGDGFDDLAASAP